PDAGAIAELLAIATGRRPDRSFGKPSPELVEEQLKIHGLSAQQVVVVGDRIYTDMALAKALGARFIGVLSGESTRRDYEDQGDIMIVPSVGHLADAWDLHA